MDQEWQLLDFDSRVLDVKTACINGCVGDRLLDVLNECASNAIELAYFSPATSSLVPQLSEYPAILASTNVFFETKLPVVIHVDKNPEVRLDTYPKGAASDEVLALGLLSGRWSRFRMDPSMSPAQFEAVYREWTTNSTQRLIADEVIIAYLNDLPVGLLTIKRSIFRVATIGLLAVAASARRKGVGAMLISSACEWATRAKCQVIQVATQKANLDAQMFYSKMGFVVWKEKPFYHFWINTSRDIAQNVPYFTGNEMKCLQKALASKRIESCGEYSRACQQLLTDKFGCAAALLTGSGTSALEQAALLCNLQVGDEVIMPSYTFVSTANAFVLRGARVVFVDVCPDTLNIDATEIALAITTKTRAIVVVHYGGIGCDMETIQDIAKKHNLILIEDAAHAIFSTRNQKFLGTTGDMACFSFHYTKNIICGEGGALIINNPKFVERAHVVWEKGTNRFDFLSRKVDKYEWVDLGSSFVPSEINATFLYAQLHAAEEINARRVRVSHAYYELLSGLQEAGFLRLMPVNKYEHNGHIFWMIMASEQNRIDLCSYLSKHGIQGYSHYVPLHTSLGGTAYGTVRGQLPNTIVAGTRLIRLPLWPHMTWVHVHRVVVAVSNFFGAKAPSAQDVANFFDPCI